MPNDISNAIHSAEHAIEGWVKDTLEPALEKEWTILKPEVMQLGQTVLSVVWQAAITYVTSGGNGGAAALSAIKAALPAEEQAAEHILMAALSGAIANLTAKRAAGQPVQ